jgi:hypothetical protein
MLADIGVFQKLGVDPVPTAPQTLHRETGFEAGAEAIYIGGGLVPPADLEAYGIPITQSIVDKGTATYFSYHTGPGADANAMANKTWRRICVREMGLKFTVNINPPDNLAAQTLWVTGMAGQYAPSDNDLVLINWNPGYGENGSMPVGCFAVSDYGGGQPGLKLALHTLNVTNPGMAALDHDIYIVRNPERYFQVITVDVDPPNIANNQDAVKFDVAIPAGIAQVGDFIAMIPPYDLEADLFPLGAYLSSATNIKLGLHCISAVNGGSKTWKFVVIPGDPLLVT